MILLLGTTDSLAVITASGVVNIDMHCSYMDYNAGAVTPGSTNNVVSTAATTTVAAAPGSGIQRNVKALIIHNTHASSSNLVTIQVVSGATAVLYAYTLLAGETLQYYDTLGFQVMDASGALKLAPGTGRFLKRTVYTSGTNTFTPTPSSKTLMVQVQGGGGGGGASGTGNAGNNNAGGGGGSGSLTIKQYVVSAAATYTATVGGGGAGGVAPSNNGTTGTLSSFTDGTTQINGAGGLGGVFGPNIAAAIQLAAGGAGGAANANGDVNGSGAHGEPAMRLAAAVVVSGGGGSSELGGGAVGATNPAPGVGTAATNYGSGGAGGSTNNASGAAGGVGSGGIIIVDEFS